MKRLQVIAVYSVADTQNNSLFEESWEWFFSPGSMKGIMLSVCCSTAIVSCQGEEGTMLSYQRRASFHSCPASSDTDERQPRLFTHSELHNISVLILHK